MLIHPRRGKLKLRGDKRKQILIPKIGKTRFCQLKRRAHNFTFDAQLVVYGLKPSQGEGEINGQSERVKKWRNPWPISFNLPERESLSSG